MPGRRSRSVLFRVGQVLGFWIAVHAASGQTFIFHLENGDRITGRILAEAEGQVTVDTSFAGSIILDRAAILRLEELPAPVTGPDEPVPDPVDADPPPLVTPAPVPAGPVAVTEDAVEVEEERRRLAELGRFLTTWQGEVQVGLNLGFGTRRRQTYYGRFKATHAQTFADQRVLRNTLDFKADYGRTDGTLSDNRMDGSWKVEYDIARRVSLYNALGAGYDQVRNIDFQYDVGPGAGYKWVMRTNFVFKTEFGGNFQQQYLFSEGTRSRYSLRLAEDFWWQLSPRFRLDQKVEFFPEIEDFGAFRVRAEGNLRYLLRDNLTLNLTVMNLYDSHPPRNASHNDLQVRSTLGLKY